MDQVTSASVAPTISMISADWGIDEDGNMVAGGSCFHRIVQPAQAMIQYGGANIQIADRFQQTPDGEIHPIINNEVRDATDVVVFQRWMHQAGAQVTQRAQAAGQVIIQDVDDWYWGLATTNNAFLATHPKYNPEVNRNHYWKTLSKADLITVSTPYLQTRLEKLRVPIKILPNAINLDLYDPNQPSDTDQPTIGWVGATPWRSGDLEVLRGVIGPFMVKHGLKFIHGGYTPKGERAAVQLGLVRDGVDLVPIEQRDLCRIEEYPQLFPGIDIGIAPLADREFNSAKCVDINTRVATPNGIVTAQELTTGDLVWNGTRWAEVEAVEPQEIREALRFTMASGRQIVITPEHRMWVDGVKEHPIPRYEREILVKKLRNNGWSYKQISEHLDISIATAHRDVNDKAVTVAEPETPRLVPHDLHGWQQAQDLLPGHCFQVSPWEFGEKIQDVRVHLLHGRVRRLGLPEASESLPIIRIDENWAELLGAFAGDGSLTSSGGISIACDGRDGDVIERWIHLYAQIGLIATAKTDSRNGPRRRYVHTTSALLQALLVQLGLGAVRDGKPLERTPCIPEVIWRSPKHVVSRFLRGWFEADGTTGKDSALVSGTSKDERLIRGIQMLLLGFDITSDVTSYNGTGKYADRTYWDITLGRRETELFFQKIGMVGAHKMGRLADRLSRKTSGRTDEITWTDEIVSIEKTQATTLDIQVDGQQFIANGLLSHNSNCKFLEYSAAGVPCIASRFGPYEDLDSMGASTCRRPKDWIREFTRLLDPAERSKQRQAQLDAVQPWDITNRWQYWLDAYTEALSQSH